MAIARKPKATEKAKPKKVDEAKIQSLINKGGSPAQADLAAKQSKQEEVPAVALRVPTPLLEKIDTAVAARILKTPRHTWILEALLEKLERE